MIGALALCGLAACTERERPLPGLREDLRAIFADEATPEPVNQTVALALPAPVAPAGWAGYSGAPARTPHLALSAAPQQIFAVDIGQGDSGRARITANPVVADGRVFTLDAGATVAATATSGAALWRRDLTPERDNSAEATGGGIAHADGVVYVSTSFGLLTALAADTGAVIWSQKLEATGSGTPTVANGLVYLTAGDDTGWAVDAATGRVRWLLSGTPDVANVLGAPAPAVTDGLVIFGFGDGEVQAAFAQGGLPRWSTQVAGQRRFDAGAKISDITGDPIVVDGQLYVGSAQGRLVALNPDSGERIWTATEGTMGPVWPVAGAVFAVSDRGELLRLAAEDGAIIWRVPLPGFTTDRPRRQLERFTHHGPVVAGGRVVVASSDGFLRFFDPASGASVGQVAIPGGATTAPAIAGGVLYVVSTRGQLVAFR